MAWQANEFTQARWNPLATTHRDEAVDAASTTVGVQNYVSLTQGLRASAETLTGGARPSGIRRSSTRSVDARGAMKTADAIRASAWCRGCSNGGYVTELVPIVQAYFDRYVTRHA